MSCNLKSVYFISGKKVIAPPTRPTMAKIADHLKLKSKNGASPKPIIKRMLNKIRAIPCSCLFTQSLAFLKFKYVVFILPHANKNSKPADSANLLLRIYFPVSFSSAAIKTSPWSKARASMEITSSAGKQVKFLTEKRRHDHVVVPSGQNQHVLRYLVPNAFQSEFPP